MSVATSVRLLVPDDAAELVALRRRALEDYPLAFEGSLEDDLITLDYARVALADPTQQAVFGYFSRGVLTGMVGVYRPTKIKQRHHANIWGMYVAPHARQRGVGRAMLSAAIAHASAWPGIEQVHLSVTEAASAARRLYESAGFECWGRQPRALLWQGRYLDDFHFVLHLVAGD
jgi:RimJ/RimL family protein N-acetyltransferase